MSNQLFVPPHYPLRSFLPVVSNAALELQHNAQAADALVGLSMIFGMTLACQGLIQVRLPIDLIRPVTQFGFVSVDSGKGKSTILHYVFKPVYDVDALAATLYEAALETYQTELDWWKTVNNGIRRQIEKAFRRGEAMDETKIKLAAHAKLKPKKPKRRAMIRNDLTQRAIMDALEGNGESFIITTDDGDSLFKSAAMSNLAVLNLLWDSPKSLSLDRADHEHVTVMNPFVSIFIMTQPEVLEAFQGNRGKLARASGYWARNLPARPHTPKGTRCIAANKLEWVHLPIFHERMRELLTRYQEKMSAGRIECEILEFSDDAKARWIQQANKTEWMTRPGEYLNDIDDFASKTMEIIARLAATMHYFAGESGKISLDTLERAIEIIGWHVDEYKRFFSPQFVVPQYQIDAHKVALWLRTRIWAGPNSDTVIPKNHVLHHGPVRNRDQLNAALDFLAAQGGVQVIRASDPKDRKTYVRLMNIFFATVTI